MPLILDNLPCDTENDKFVEDFEKFIEQYPNINLLFTTYLRHQYFVPSPLFDHNYTTIIVLYDDYSKSDKHVLKRLVANLSNKHETFVIEKLRVSNDDEVCQVVYASNASNSQETVCINESCYKYCKSYYCYAIYSERNKRDIKYYVSNINSVDMTCVKCSRFTRNDLDFSTLFTHEYLKNKQTKHLKLDQTESENADNNYFFTFLLIIIWIMIVCL
ncbi:hypothetical protein Hokovirus_1_135 [Hokovirus HKV1]|uniref:Uncharacterized protein n=1 Tax=Hokovirus HKV1 TaxID=1977638 RepID=A0A1V0SEW3_9VIRU|nr:hypothetical protein Hokovirus_1_135 [Hokovirus HKV1]